MNSKKGLITISIINAITKSIKRFQKYLYITAVTFMTCHMLNCYLLLLRILFLLPPKPFAAQSEQQSMP